MAYTVKRITTSQLVVNLGKVSKLTLGSSGFLSEATRSRPSYEKQQ